MNRLLARVTLLIALIAFLALAFTTTASAGRQAQSEPPPPGPGSSPTLVPEVEPETPATPGVGAGVGAAVTSIVQQVIRFQFPAATLTDTLIGVFSRAAKKEEESAEKQVDLWKQTIGEIILPPPKDMYAQVARNSLPTAAALAIPLFLLRLAIYHWRRLVGEEDDGLRVIGDWVMSAVLAVLVGVLLDYGVQVGWWMSGRVLGETNALAIQFAGQMSAGDMLYETAKPTLFGSLFNIIFALGGLVSLAGITFAFAAATAALYLLAVIGPPLMVVSVVPDMSWVRSLWFKAVALLAIFPILAGGIFKAAVAASAPTGGLIGDVIHLLWLWGAAGAMVSLASVVSKVTLTAAAESAQQMVSGAVQVGGLMVAAATGVGALAAGGAAVSGGTAASAIGNLQSAQSLSQAGSAMNTLGSMTGARGFNAAGSMLNAQAGQYSLAANMDRVKMQEGQALQRTEQFAAGMSQREAQHSAQMAQREEHHQAGLAQKSGLVGDFGFSFSTNKSLSQAIPGRDHAERAANYNAFMGAIGPHIQSAFEGGGLTNDAFVVNYSGDRGFAALVDVYMNPAHADQINGSSHPLYEAAKLSGYTGLQKDIEDGL